MALEGPSGFPIDVDDFTVWIARQIDSNLHFDFSHFFINFGLGDQGFNGRMQ